MNEEFNKVLTVLINTQDYTLPALIDYSLNHEVANINAAIADFERLGILNSRMDSKRQTWYLLKQNVRTKLLSLPREFENRPYEYLIDEEVKNFELENSRNWYETENAKKQYEDFPNVDKRSRDSIMIAKITLGVTLVLEVLKWKCNR